MLKDVPATAVPGFWDSLALNANTWAGEVTASIPWQTANAASEAWSREFAERTSGSLLPHPGLPAFLGKGQPRLREKTEQMVEEDGVAATFPLQHRPVPAVGDMVRTRIAVSYFDGVLFLADKLTASLESAGRKVERVARAYDSGYYALHLSFDHKTHFTLNGEQTPTLVKCEVQIATDLATKVWGATHALYEKVRVEATDKAWKWNHKSPQFLAAQVGHMIHLADGLLTELRESVKNQKGSR